MNRHQDTVLDVEGMTCPSCIRHVSSALTALDGVGQVDVKLREGVVHVKHDGRATLADMIEALTNAGYVSKAH
jgi:copper chaperone